MTDEEMEEYAKEWVTHMAASGHARELMEAWADHKQSCHYVYSILHHFAYEVDTGISDEIVNFARNLLDDWSK